MQSMVLGIRYVLISFKINDFVFHHYRALTLLNAFCSFHPTLPLLASSCGQRLFITPGSTYDDEDIDQDPEEHSLTESSVKLWLLLSHTHTSNT